MSWNEVGKKVPDVIRTMIALIGVEHLSNTDIQSIVEPKVRVMVLP